MDTDMNRNVYKFINGPSSRWTVEEMRPFSGWPVWRFFKGRHLWTAWREDNKEMFIKCKRYESLMYWVKLASKKQVDCAVCKNCQVGGCGHCRQKRINHSQVLSGTVKDYDSFKKE